MIPAIRGRARLGVSCETTIYKCSQMLVRPRSSITQTGNIHKRDIFTNVSGELFSWARKTVIVKLKMVVHKLRDF